MKTIVEARFSLVASDGKVITRGTGACEGATIDAALKAMRLDVLPQLPPELQAAMATYAMEFHIISVVLMSDQSALIKPASGFLRN